MEQMTIMTVDEYQKTTNRIKENLAGIVDRFVYVGWLLNKIVKTEGYKLGGYNTIAEYAKAELGNMSADTVSRFVNVFKTYGAGEDTPELKEEYRSYRYSMLVEMLQLPEEDRAMLSPDTPRAAIRDLNRFNAEQESGTDALFGWQQDTADLVRTAVSELAGLHEPERLRSILENEDQEKKLIEVMCPSGSRTFKKGLVFMILSTEDIKVKVFGRENREISWKQMAELIKETLPKEKTEIAPAQEDLEVEKIPEEDITIEEEQIPGQDSILNHPEFMPKPETPEKTEEQKYDEQQARIDRKTKEKLQEMEDEEKMNHLPKYEGERTKTIRIGYSYYEEMMNGRNFDLREKRDYRAGDIMEYMLFDQDKFTGKSLKRRIVFILDEATGLEDGWCILGLK